MEIREGSKRFFIGEDENEPIAEIVYSYKDKNVIVIESTFVAESLRGQNIAARLLEKVISKARSDGLKIIPKCSYAEKVMKKGDKYSDVLFIK
jgi:hypothetical protein